VIRLLVERGLTIGPDSLETGLAVLEEIRNPPHTFNIADVLRSSNMSTKEALDFLRRYRGKYIPALDTDGHLAIFVDRLSGEMLIRQHRDRENLMIAPLDWVHAGQILPKVDATLEEFYAWVDTNVRRKEDKDWMIARDNVVLLHYSLKAVAPFILSHTRNNRGGIQPSKAKDSS
jgi:hypothetical protein